MLFAAVLNKASSSAELNAWSLDQDLLSLKRPSSSKEVRSFPLH